MLWQFSGGYMVDEINEVRAQLSYQRAGSDIVDLGTANGTDLVATFDDYKSWTVEAGYRHFFATRNVRLRPYGGGTIGVAIIDEIDGIFAAPQAGITRSATDFYDGTAAFSFGVNGGAFTPSTTGTTCTRRSASASTAACRKSTRYAEPAWKGLTTRARAGRCRSASVYASTSEHLKPGDVGKPTESRRVVDTERHRAPRDRSRPPSRVRVRQSEHERVADEGQSTAWMPTGSDRQRTQMPQPEGQRWVDGTQPDVVGEQCHVYAAPQHFFSDPDDHAENDRRDDHRRAGGSDAWQEHENQRGRERPPQRKMRRDAELSSLVVVEIGTIQERRVCPARRRAPRRTRGPNTG